MFLPDTEHQPGPGVYRWIVVISREGDTEVTGFWEREDAEEFFSKASAQWSESFLTEVVKGPLT